VLLLAFKEMPLAGRVVNTELALQQLLIVPATGEGRVLTFRVTGVLTELIPDEGVVGVNTTFPV
jgi:hypothetical protein